MCGSEEPTFGREWLAEVLDLPPGATPGTGLIVAGARRRKKAGRPLSFIELSRHNPFYQHVI